MREAIRETMREKRPDGEAEYWQVRRREGWRRQIGARTRRTRRERQEQMSVLRFVVTTTDGLVVRLLLGAGFSGLLAAGMTLLVASEGTGEWPPQQLTSVAMVAVGVIVAAVVSLFIVLRAVLRSLVRVTTQPEQVGSALPASETPASVRGATVVATSPHG
jgi:ABC-type anion transport system duplicated permease subunit